MYIHIQRLIILAVRLPGLCALPIKHIVRANIGHLAIQFLANVRNVLGTTSIDCTNFCYFIVILCHIHSSPRCTVNHSIWIYAAVVGTDIRLPSGEKQNPMREVTPFEEIFWPLEMVKQKLGMWDGYRAEDKTLYIKSSQLRQYGAGGLLRSRRTGR